MTGSPLLVLDHVSAAYGPFRALFDVSFAVRDEFSGPTRLVGFRDDDPRNGVAGGDVFEQRAAAAKRLVIGMGSDY